MTLHPATDLGGVSSGRRWRGGCNWKQSGAVPIFIWFIFTEQPRCLISVVARQFTATSNIL